VVLKNLSSSPLLFENQMEYSFYSSSPVFEIPALGSYTLRIKTLKEMDSVDLKLKAIGSFTSPKESPVVTWKISVEKFNLTLNFKVL